jgi:hypothetical protein
MPIKNDNKMINTQKMTSHQLSQKAAGYMLAAANAAKIESQKKTNIKKY